MRQHNRTEYNGWIWIVSLSLVVLLSGCRTVAIRPERNIVAPPGLTKEQVQVAVLGAILNQPKDSLPVGAAIADRALQAGLMGYRGLTADRHPWYFEGQDGDAILSGFQMRDLYLQARCRCTATSVGITISRSEGFRQSSTRIHEDAYVYTERLVARIRRSLGEVARIALHANTAPPSFSGPPSSDERDLRR
jgi:hypothetical protein